MNIFEDFSCRVRDIVQKGSLIKVCKGFLKDVLAYSHFKDANLLGFLNINKVCASKVFFLCSSIRCRDGYAVKEGNKVGIFLKTKREDYRRKERRKRNFFHVQLVLDSDFNVAFCYFSTTAYSCCR